MSELLPLSLPAAYTYSTQFDPNLHPPPPQHQQSPPQRSRPLQLCHRGNLHAGRNVRERLVRYDTFSASTGRVSPYRTAGPGRDNSIRQQRHIRLRLCSSAIFHSESSKFRRNERSNCALAEGGARGRGRGGNRVNTTSRRRHGFGFGQFVQGEKRQCIRLER